jgi:predicted nuclease of restriction endonuclease-like (RecB) superfamily
MSNIELPPTLLDALRGLIIQARQQALRSVDTIQVHTYWQIGRHIVEFEQGGQARAAYGKRLLAELAAVLTGEFGKGFDERNLRNMRAFFQYFPNWNALRSELSWTHYRLLLRVDTPEARLWYIQEAAAQNWSTRVLERQIGTLYYNRLLSSPDKDRLLAETWQTLQAQTQTPRDFVRDPVMLEFLGLPDTGRLMEAELERALMDKLQHFLLELGNILWAIAFPNWPSRDRFSPLNHCAIIPQIDSDAIALPQCNSSEAYRSQVNRESALRSADFVRLYGQTS